uniref:GYF domain-containing protein n=1 Tax=Bartheletia paradoxa TaxID=669517 RepID=A0A2D0XHT3_9BASI|nr:hypothetical protein SPAR03380 [Bartheletia paradoxa]
MSKRGSSPAPPSKRTRFAEPALPGAGSSSHTHASASTATTAMHDDEADLSAPRARKGAVRQEGYDSDSSDDGEGQRAAAKKADKAAGEVDEDDDDDMFGGPSTSTKQDAELSVAEQRKQGERHMTLGEIEGQEFGGLGDRDSEDDGEEDEFDSEEELNSVGSEGEGEVKKTTKRGMGVKIEAFNMKDDLNTGAFTESGAYIPHKADPLALHDSWLSGLSKADMRAARTAHEAREAAAAARVAAEDQARESPEQTWMGLCETLEKGETVLEALARLGAVARAAKAVAAKESKAAKKGKPKRPANDNAMDEDPPAPSAVSAGKAAETPAQRELSHAQADVKRLTDLAVALLAQHQGDTAAYEESYESLLRQVRRSGVAGPDWTPASKSTADSGSTSSPLPPSSSPRRWSYRWSPAYIASHAATATDGAAPPDASQVFGPFGEAEMRAWGTAGYFGVGGERVLLRTEGEGSAGEWVEWANGLGADTSL